MLHFVSGGGVFDSGKTTARGYVKVRCVAGASRNAALGGSHICRSFDSIV